MLSFTPVAFSFTIPSSCTKCGGRFVESSSAPPPPLIARSPTPETDDADPGKGVFPFSLDSLLHMSIEKHAADRKLVLTIQRNNSAFWKIFGSC